jgi:hypothetical protein
MNVFQLIKTVLDELYVRIPGDTETKDNEIKKRIQSLSKGYEDLAKGVTNDYSDVATRFAYIYKYVTSHANIVYQLIQGSSELADLFDRDKVNVTCIGGGPGSDFLGILKYVIKEEKNPRLRCTLFDKERAWGESWQDVDEKLEPQLAITTVVQPFDVTDKEGLSNYGKYLNADLFTMVYFMSEVDSLRESAEPFFTNLFEKAKTGAMFLYVDNNNEQFYGWFDSLAAAHSLEVLQSSEIPNMLISDFSEEKKDLGRFWEKFESPKLRANIAFRVCRKR